MRGVVRPSASLLGGAWADQGVCWVHKVCIQLYYSRTAFPIHTIIKLYVTDLRLKIQITWASYSGSRDHISLLEHETTVSRVHR